MSSMNTKKSLNPPKTRKAKPANKSNKNIGGMFKNPDPVPNSMRGRLGWSYIGTALSTASDDFNFVRFKLNSVNDPGLSLATTSAYAYLSRYTQYASFLVTKAYISVEAVNTDNDVPFRLSVTPSLENPNRVAAWTADSAIINSNYSKVRLVGNATGMDRVKIEHAVDIGALAGIGKLCPKDFEYTGSTSGSNTGASDPAALGSWIVAVQAVDAVTDNLDLVLSVRLSYDVVFYNYIMPLWDVPTLSPIL